eukprot:Rmarinus@m.9683
MLAHSDSNQVHSSPCLSYLGRIPTAFDRLSAIHWRIIFLVTVVGLWAPIPLPPKDNQLEVEAKFQVAHEIYKNDLHSAEVRLMEAQDNLARVQKRASNSGQDVYHQSHTDSVVIEYERRVAEAKVEVEVHEARYLDKLNEARKTAGIWSKEAISEARSLFWKSLWSLANVAVTVMFTTAQLLSVEGFTLTVLLPILQELIFALPIALCWSWVASVRNLVMLLLSYGAAYISMVLFFAVFMCCGAAWVFAIRCSLFALKNVLTFKFSIQGSRLRAEDRVHVYKNAAKELCQKKME